MRMHRAQSRAIKAWEVERRKARKAEGSCVNCGRARDTETAQCSACRASKVQSEQRIRELEQSFRDLVQLKPAQVKVSVPKHLRVWPVPLPGSIAHSMCWIPRRTEANP